MNISLISNLNFKLKINKFLIFFWKNNNKNTENLKLKITQFEVFPGILCLNIFFIRKFINYKYYIGTKCNRNNNIRAFETFFFTPSPWTLFFVFSSATNSNSYVLLWARMICLLRLYDLVPNWITIWWLYKFTVKTKTSIRILHIHF